MAEQTVEVGNAIIVLAGKNDPFHDGRTTGYLEFYDERHRPTFPLTSHTVHDHLQAIMQEPSMPSLWKAGRITGWMEALMENAPQTFRSVLVSAVPVKLADYHKEALTDPKTGQTRKLNSSVQLNKREGVWWLTLSYDEEIILETLPDAPVVGIDVGVANFVTTSTGKHYGSFHTKLRARHQRDRAKRRRKAKLRACLKKKGVKNLPSTSSRTGQKLIRQTRQAINHAVNQCFADPEHEGVQFAYEQLSVASMRFKARAQNAYLRASHLGHIPAHIHWNSQKRGVKATPVKSRVQLRGVQQVPLHRPQEST